MRARHFSATAALLLLATGIAPAAEVTLIGLFPGKAVVQIDAGAPRTMSVGQKSPEGVTLVSVDRGTATFEVGGRRMSLKMGQFHAAAGGGSGTSVVLSADARGHFVADGQINGLPMRFVVDTGATLVSIPAAEAARIALDYRNGERVMINTANGTAVARKIRLDTVRIGEVTVNGIDAVVIDNSALPLALLGMSFLNRMDMKRDGQTMTLTKRY